MLDLDIMSPEIITASLVCLVAGFLNVIYTRIEPLLEKSQAHGYRFCAGFSLFACSLFVLYLGGDCCFFGR